MGVTFVYKAKEGDTSLYWFSGVLLLLIICYFSVSFLLTRYSSILRALYYGELSISSFFKVFLGLSTAVANFFFKSTSAYLVSLSCC